MGASDSLLTLGWAKPWEDQRWFPRSPDGRHLKVLKKTLDNESAVGYMADVGVIYKARGEWSQGIRAAFALQNVGTGLDFEGEKTPFPTMMKAGAAYWFLRRQRDSGRRFGFAHGWKSLRESGSRIPGVGHFSVPTGV